MLNRRLVLHATDATPARWRGDVGSAPLDRASAATSSPSAPDTLVDFPQVDAPPVSMEAIDEAAELTKGKVAEGGAATTDAVKKAVVGPAQ